MIWYSLLNCKGEVQFWCNTKKHKVQIVTFETIFTVFTGFDQKFSNNGPCLYIRNTTFNNKEEKELYMT